MNTVNQRIAEYMCQEYRKEDLANAETHRMLREAGLIQQDFVPRILCKGIAALGRVLIVFGRRLAQADQPIRASLAHPASLRRI